MQDSEMNNIWNKVKSLMVEELSEIRYKSFIEPLRPVYADSSVFVLSSPDDFSLERVLGMKSFIENCFQLSCPIQFKIEIKVDGTKELTDLVRNLSIRDNETSTSSDHSGSFLNSQYTFDNFIVGAGNRFAHAACVAVAENMTKNNYNPLFLYGGSGLGKTHLMQAIGNYVQEKFPDKKVVYVQSEKFVNDFIASILHGEKFDTFREQYRNLDFLLIDDIQFIEGKLETQKEFFHTFNEISNLGKNIVITCDKPPQSMTSLEDRLRTRIASGLIVDIQPPDYETRLAILRKRCIQNKIDVPEDILNYIASNISSNIREMDGAFNTVIAYCLLANSYTLETAVTALKDIIQPKSTRVMNHTLLIEVVARYFNISVSDIMSNRRSKDILVPRQICMYLCRYELDMTYPRIGEVFGGKDHTTVMHACNKIVTEQSLPNSEIAVSIDNIKKRLFS